MQNATYIEKDYTSRLNADIKKLPSFSHVQQAMPSIVKYSRLPPYHEGYPPHFPHFQYDQSEDNLHHLHEALENGSHRRKNLPSKMSHEVEDQKVHVQTEEETKHFLPSHLPLFYHLSPFSSYNAKRVDFPNIGLQYFRTMDPFWLSPLKQDTVRTNAVWPAGSLCLHPSYPLFHKNYPDMMLPFHVPTQTMPVNPSFNTIHPADDAVSKATIQEQDDNKHKVERVDVNIQIDDSFYVEVGNQKRWKCPMCEKSYTSKYNLVTHILGHSGIKPHACSRCGKLFKQLSHLHTHMLTHQGTRPHKCQVCNKAFTQTSHLKRHMMQHSDVKPYNCRICGRGFAYPSELKVHKSKHESGRENICVECGLDFPTLAQLKRHLAAHRGPIQYNCSECDKTFQYPSQLQNHMMKHKDIRPYICSECGMEFVQPHHLKQHSLTHKGVKEHKCGICGREFTLLANMKRHILIHTNIRAYQCHLCFKSFVQKQTLKAHMIVHSDIKPFKCKLCGKEFNRMHNLMGHMHLHSNSKPFKCLYCPSKFTLKGNLTRHMKVKHGVNERGFHSRGFTRVRADLSHSIVHHNMEQKEPYDLSRKKGDEETSCHSDGESVKSNSFQEEEEDDTYNSQRKYQKDIHKEPTHLSEKHGHFFKEMSKKDNQEILYKERDAERISNQHKEERTDVDLDHKEGSLGLSVPYYLYLKNRNTDEKLVD
ncbi:zinc finger protein 366 [Hyla sarda]|uniref:zinc finger protein 366 n=1 Tax=Hyla sarda TaxID=327740 RepID=UPI0024C37078|nr:zinc finger protein 366 [Hyla sarda]XP_056395739.1 zinc finger protein 366 [Hyla sarda]XP_056395743.1 zinc finger protein 366 [Hyla sarda]